MAKPKLYLESTVISVYTSRPSRDPLVAAMQKWTHLWWDTRRDSFELFISKSVIDEIVEGDPVQAAKRLAIAKEIAVLPDTKTSRRFARKLVRSLSLPHKSRADAFHIAIAIENSMSYLLTWNCVHIANPVYVSRIRAMATQRGFELPVICSPRDFLGVSDAAESD